MSVPIATHRVLPTLNEDGTRRWIRPKPSHGAFYSKRRAVAYVLMVVFFISSPLSGNFGCVAGL